MADSVRPLSVTEAMTLAKRALEQLSLVVVGEVSDCTERAGYKAVYFTIGDGSSVMPCLMWRDVYAASGVQLRSGMLVQVTGKLSAYAPKGRLQFLVSELTVAGEGVLRMQVAALARKLEAEGLMRPERRRALPSFPQRIGLVTSPRGKAVHDVIRTLARRYPVAELVIAGVAVEGATATAAIVKGLEATAAAGVDVLILARGGGSYEDLMPFNDEQVVRAIAACEAPVVTGIGHEPDVTLADMVADARASTPTAAAEAVAPSVADVSARFGGLARLLGRGLRHAAQASERRLAVVEASAVLKDPRAALSVVSQRLDISAGSMARSLSRSVSRAGERARLSGERLNAAGTRILEKGRDRLAMTAARLEDLSPLGILGRGYAVCYDQAGRHVVRSAGTLTEGTGVLVRLHDGSADCRVERVHVEESHE